jgi:hypothetical protein
VGRRVPPACLSRCSDPCGIRRHPALKHTHLQPRQLRLPTGRPVGPTKEDR